MKDDPCVGFLLVAHCCHFLFQNDMTNSRSVAHNFSDVYPPEWNRCITSPDRYLKSSTLLMLSQRNSDQFPGIGTFWKGTPHISRQRHDSGIFNRKSDFAMTA